MKLLYQPIYRKNHEYQRLMVWFNISSNNKCRDSIGNARKPTFKISGQLLCHTYMYHIVDCLSLFKNAFKITCKLSRFSGKFTDYLESQQIFCELSKFIYIFHVAQKFQDCLESFQIVWKLSRMSRKFSDCPESSFIFEKVSALCGIFLYHFESVQFFQQVKRVKRQSKKCCKHGLFPKMI